MKTTDKPTFQSFHIEGVKYIHPADALEILINGQAVMIDVREMNEVQLESVPLERVLNHPMSVINDRLPYISKDQQIIVACPGGIRSVKVAHLLNQEGYPQVASLDGGFTLWKAKGLPFANTPPMDERNCQAGKQTASGGYSIVKAPQKNSCIVRDFKNLRRI